MSEKLNPYEEYEEYDTLPSRTGIRRTLNKKHIPKKQVGKNADHFGKHKKNMEGDVCRVNGRQYLITQQDDVYDYATGKKVVDPNVIAKIFEVDNDFASRRQINLLDYEDYRAWMHEVDEGERDPSAALGEELSIEEMAKMRRNCIGHMSCSEGSYVEYAVNDFDYYVDREGCVFYQDREFKLQPLTDMIIIAVIRGQIEEDKCIEAAREKVADKQAKEDPVLKRVLNWHLAFTSGRIEPTIKNGITFYRVGRNASHEFYAGVKDGKKYKYTAGEGYDEKGDFYPDEKIYEVEEWGYMGHY